MECLIQAQKSYEHFTYQTNPPSSTHILEKYKRTWKNGHVIMDMGDGIDV